MKANEEITKLMQWDLKHFKDRESYFLFGLKEIEKHMPELRELNEAKDPHLLDEIADVYIWSRMVLEAHKINDEIILKRVDRFREKISAHRGKK